MIKRIVSVRIVRLWDTCQTVAYVDFVLDNDHRGFISGDCNSLHIAALMARAEREGVHVTWDDIEPHAGEGEI